MDITTDPRWINYRELAAVHGLRACWSTPIFDCRGEVLGTFAMYFREVRSPTPEELQLVGDATAAAALAIEHVRIRDSLARTIGQLEATIEATADGILVVDRNGTIQRYNRRVLDMWGIPERLMEAGDMKQVQAIALPQLRTRPRCCAATRRSAGTPEAPALDVLQLKDGREFERYHQVQRIGAEVTGDARGASATSPSRSGLRRPSGRASSASGPSPKPASKAWCCTRTASSCWRMRGWPGCMGTTSPS